MHQMNYVSSVFLMSNWKSKLVCKIYYNSAKVGAQIRPRTELGSNPSKDRAGVKSVQGQSWGQIRPRTELGSNPSKDRAGVKSVQGQSYACAILFISRMRKGDIDS
jgi:hypothetical protein